MNFDYFVAPTQRSEYALSRFSSFDWRRNHAIHVSTPPRAVVKTSIFAAILALGVFTHIASAAAAPPNRWVDTAFGHIRLGTVLGVCHSESVYIGRIVTATGRKETWYPSSTMKRIRVVTDFKFQVERSIKGKNDHFEYLTLIGGSVPGMTMRSAMDDRLPKAVPGRRYLIGQKKAGDGSSILKAVLRIDDDATLPSLRDILAETDHWKEVYCE